MNNSVRILLIVLSSIFITMPVYAQEHAKKKVAVYMTGTTSDAAYKKVIGAKLVNAITESGEYAAVERTADFLAALSAESDYQTSGEVRDSQIARLGQKFGVRYVVVADASELFDEYFIAARMINVETGLVERAFDINGPADSMAQLVDLSKKVSKGLLNNSENTHSNTSDQSEISGISKEPIETSLFAYDTKDGHDVYIAKSTWEKFTIQETKRYMAKGICYFYNKDSYIFVSSKVDKGSWTQCRSYCPSRKDMSIIANNEDELNDLLSYFNFEYLIGNYWTYEEASSTEAISFRFFDNTFRSDIKGCNLYVRWMYVGHVK